MFRQLPLFTHWMSNRSPIILQRVVNRSLSSSTSGDKPRVRLYPGQQQTIEEIAQGNMPEKQQKRDIERMYEFEKLEISDQPTTRDQYRHPIERGKQGVFDLEELLGILRDERLKDICVIEIPPEQQYARYLVLATAFSARHLKNTSEYINKLYKAKKKSSDPYLSSECRDGSRWHAMDMGYLVLHLMDAEMREQNDLETLWCVGPKYDDQLHSINQSLDMIRKLDAQLKEEEILSVADKYKPLDNPFSHVRYPLEGPGIFEEPPPKKEMILGSMAHKKHQDERVNLDVEKNFVEIPSDKKPPVYEGQKIN